MEEKIIPIENKASYGMNMEYRTMEATGECVFASQEIPWRM